MTYCKYCGSRIFHYDRACPSCGGKIEETESKTLRFYTGNLLSKWGFGDGDFLSEALNLWVENEHDILYDVVKNLVVPEIKESLDIVFIGTIHNPVRAERVNGVDVDWYNPELAMSLTPEYVDVKIEDIMSIVNRLG